MRKTLFAPWRMEFIENHDSKTACVLCAMAKTRAGDKKHVIMRGKSCYVVMNKYPYSHGHLMIVPDRHESDWTHLKRDEILEIGQLTQKALSVLKKTFRCEGFNIGVNLGRAAGAGIKDHVHQHIVPRWNGDFNFMPLLGETKVISEHLDQTYLKLLKAWTKS